MFIQTNEVLRMSLTHWGLGVGDGSKVENFTEEIMLKPALVECRGSRQRAKGGTLSLSPCLTKLALRPHCEEVQGNANMHLV